MDDNTAIRSGFFCCNGNNLVNGEKGGDNDQINGQESACTIFWPNSEFHIKHAIYFLSLIDLINDLILIL